MNRKRSHDCSKKTDKKKKIFFLFNLRTLLILILSCSLIALPACKNSKKAQKAKAENEARLAKEREEEQKRKEAERKKKEEEEARQRNTKESYSDLENYFQQIANAQSMADANKFIDEAVKLCTSADTPVLLIISKSGKDVDYDKPTTIKKYSEYLKDQKKNPNKVDYLDKDVTGKITKIVLIKK
jgi:hypothetical protein